MKLIKIISLFSLVILLQACGTSYIYQGNIEAKDSLNNDRKFTLYWSKTKYPLWFGTQTGPVNLLTECSTNTVNFDETERGIIFRRRPNDEGVYGNVALNDPCGQIIGADTVKSIELGDIRITINCKPLMDDWSATNTAYLMARQDPYQFRIHRTETKDIKKDVPKSPRCESNN